MIPGSPGSGLCAESRDGPQPGGELPAGSQPGHVTAEEGESDAVNNPLLPGPSDEMVTPSNNMYDRLGCDDLTSMDPLVISRKRSLEEKGSYSNSDADSFPIKGRKKVLKARPPRH